MASEPMNCRCKVCGMVSAYIYDIYDIYGNIVGQGQLEQDRITYTAQFHTVVESIARRGLTHSFSPVTLLAGDTITLTLTTETTI